MCVLILVYFYVLFIRIGKNGGICLIFFMVFLNVMVVLKVYLGI